MSESFFQLTPDRVLEAVETSGFLTTGRCMALNSFENRVYDVELESDHEAQSQLESKSQLESELSSGLPTDRRIVKFYRPGRWTEVQILEEHCFLQDLIDAEIPAIGPLAFPDGSTLHALSGVKPSHLQSPADVIRFAIFPRVGGRAPDELTPQQFRVIGRLLGRIHNVGAARAAPNRISLTPQTYGLDNLKFLLEGDWIPLDFQSRYRAAVEGICTLSEPLFQAAPVHRLHGDCHLGNLLWDGTRAFFLDFDDMVNGPAVQDLWLLNPGRDLEAQASWESLLEGYEEMRAFDRTTLRLIEPLRALRFVHYAAWIARRWEDPAFPAAFPQFGTHRYWSDETDDLERQFDLIRKGNAFAFE